MIITISGKAGSGKSSVGILLAKKLGMKYYCIGDMRRKMAEERGLSLEEFNKLGEKESFTDIEVDKFQQELGKKEDNFVIVGRTSYHFIPHSVKVFLDVDLKIGAERIFRQKREKEHYTSLNEAIEKIKEREESDKKRYAHYYGLELLKKDFDLVIDASKLTVEQTVDRIIDFIKNTENRKKTKNRKQNKSN